MTTTDTRTDAEKLESVRTSLAHWRQLAYNASQARNAPSYGRCARRIETLERIEAALARRIAAAEATVTCDLCHQPIKAGERRTDDGSEVAHATCTADWFRRNFGREGLA